jgi:hypothetical protein
MLKHRPGAIIKALLQLTPITVVVGLGSLWIGLSWELFVAHPRTIMMSCAMAFVYLVVRPDSTRGGGRWRGQSYD